MDAMRKIASSLAILMIAVPATAQVVIPWSADPGALQQRQIEKIGVDIEMGVKSASL